MVPSRSAFRIIRMREKTSSAYAGHIQTCHFRHQSCSMAKVVPDGIDNILSDMSYDQWAW